MLANKNNDIAYAFDLLKIISNDEKARMAYEAREAELMDQRTRLNSALKKGERKAKTVMILRLLSKGMRASEIAEIAGLDVAEIITIQDDNRKQ